MATDEKEKEWDKVCERLSKRSSYTLMNPELPPLSRSLRMRIVKIPGKHGWQQWTGREAYYRLAGKLLAKGMTEFEVVDFLRVAYDHALIDYGTRQEE
jgi:hypothetical protein